ncbi:MULTISPECIES: hypothetical protein [unclassified Variovorax]|uniref:hypothetical protein n=1 Tax=unclassified Variovorax TaxID=663243 RepID=UPI00076D183B|nr:MULTISPECIES: hypothetical protein [unclassified Variovorax]KWT98231.1 hypothetical protein APY03_0902 [Variovorax sp. WDL1]
MHTPDSLKAFLEAQPLRGALLAKLAPAKDGHHPRPHLAAVHVLLSTATPSVMEFKLEHSCLLADSTSDTPDQAVFVFFQQHLKQGGLDGMTDTDLLATRYLFLAFADELKNVFSAVHEEWVPRRRPGALLLPPRRTRE